MNRRFRRYLEVLRPIVIAPTLPCFHGCGCELPAGDDEASKSTRRAHLDACPVGLQKSVLKSRASDLIAQNPAHRAGLVPVESV